MKLNLRMLVVAGARPNFMKVAPILRAIDKHNGVSSNGSQKIEALLVHTGQHYDEKMSEVFFRDLGIRPPDVNLEVGSGSHAVQTANVMLKFEPICLAQRPHWVVVVGDVNSTVACALVAAKCGIKIAHVEAGLRSFDRAMPEEINRLVTDSIADLLLTPSPDADENLNREGVAKDKIRFVGNVMIDSLISNLDQARKSRILSQFGLKRGEFAFVTLHRPANVDDETTLTAIMRELRELSERLKVIFPMHPRTRKMLETYGLDSSSTPRFQIIEPIGYHDSLFLTENARLVLTDSGGLQEETTYFRIPCLTLRPNTERPVTISMGSNRLTSIHKLHADLNQAMAPTSAENAGVPPLWDGKSGERCVRAILAASL